MNRLWQELVLDAEIRHDSEPVLHGEIDSTLESIEKRLDNIEAFLHAVYREKWDSFEEKVTAK